MLHLTARSRLLSKSFVQKYKVLDVSQHVHSGKIRAVMSQLENDIQGRRMLRQVRGRAYATFHVGMLGIIEGAEIDDACENRAVGKMIFSCWSNFPVRG